MSLVNDLTQSRKQHFTALILDNEVTVSEFVTEPPLPWARIVQVGGVFGIAAGYPKELTTALGKAEMRNWDQVSLPGINSTIPRSRRRHRLFRHRQQRRSGRAAGTSRAPGFTRSARWNHLRQQPTRAECLRIARLPQFFSP